MTSPPLSMPSRPTCVLPPASLASFFDLIFFLFSADKYDEQRRQWGTYRDASPYAASDICVPTTPPVQVVPLPPPTMRVPYLVELLTRANAQVQTKPPSVPTPTPA